MAQNFKSPKLPIGMAKIEIEGVDLSDVNGESIQIKIGDIIYSGIADDITCKNHSKPIVQGTIISMGYVLKTIFKVNLDYKKPAHKKGKG